jgi:tripartite-type tricarboxylate transporter receptor subunit TctC
MFEEKPVKLGLLNRIAALGLAAMMVAGLAHGQTYPNRSVRLVVGFAPGGQTDLIARLVAQRLSVHLGQSVVVENRAGADGVLASQQIARAEPDGYTLYLATTTHAINASLFKTANYDATADFTPISLIGEVPNLVVVKAGVNARNLAEFIADARARKGALSYATGSSVTYLAAESFNRAADIQAQRVPYKGAAPAMTALIAGDVDYTMVNGLGPVLPLLPTGKVRALAIGGSKRNPSAPDIPTASEAGMPGFTSTVWYGILGPAKLPREVVERVGAATRRLLAEPEVLSVFSAQGVEPNFMVGEEFAAFLRAEVPRWAKLIRDTGASSN